MRLYTTALFALALVVSGCSCDGGDTDPEVVDVDGDGHPAATDCDDNNALVYPGALKPVYKVWMKFGDTIGFINSRIILFIVFYLIFMPVGFLIRLFGYDPMRRKPDSSATYRVESKKPTSVHSMERPF